MSGGQKQRIAIAQALLLNPRIILDDSAGGVDVTTEALIQEALDRLMLGRTSVVIAQRVSLVLHADQILVLDRTWRQGRHRELLETADLRRDHRSRSCRRGHPRPSTWATRRMKRRTP